jgi:hypothetical protein
MKEFYMLLFSLIGFFVFRSLYRKMKEREEDRRLGGFFDGAGEKEFWRWPDDAPSAFTLKQESGRSVLVLQKRHPWPDYIFGALSYAFLCFCWGAFFYNLQPLYGSFLQNPPLGSVWLAAFLLFIWFFVLSLIPFLFLLTFNRLVKISITSDMIEFTNSWGCVFEKKNTRI